MGTSSIMPPNAHPNGAPRTTLFVVPCERGGSQEGVKASDGGKGGRQGGGVGEGMTLHWMKHTGKYIKRKKTSRNHEQTLTQTTCFHALIAFRWISPDLFSPKAIGLEAQAPSSEECQKEQAGSIMRCD